MLKHMIQNCLRLFGLRLCRVSNAPATTAEEQSNKLWIRDFGIRTVLDIGANTGQFAREIRTVLPNAWIYSFEPIEACFLELKRTMESDAKFVSFNFALSDEDGETIFRQNEFSPSSSVLPMAERHRMAFPYTKKSHDIKVSMKRLDDLIGELDIQWPLLVKIDVQGFEDHVLRGGQQAIQNAKLVLVETSFEELYEGQPLFDDIYQYLVALGFEYKGAMHQLCAPGTNQPLQEDSVFVNPLLSC